MVKGRILVYIGESYSQVKAVQARTMRVGIWTRYRGPNPWRSSRLLVYAQEVTRNLQIQEVMRIIVCDSIGVATGVCLSVSPFSRRTGASLEIVAPSPRADPLMMCGRHQW